jgi:hypothetical protein
MNLWNDILEYQQEQVMLFDMSSLQFWIYAVEQMEEFA